MKRLFKDKRGMTLTEMLVALTLLMIVVVGTTPVMLSSYDSLYQAGEKTQQSYNAKSEIEDTLATRNSINIVENFKVNFEGLGEVASINGKRAVSSLETSLETVFSGGRAYVTIVSSKVINDDKLSHDVILQTTNVSFAGITDISYNTPSAVSPTGKSVDVSLYLPDKSTNSLAAVYAKRANTAEKGIIVDSVNPATGRIYVKVNGVDFTNSPAKIEVTYLDENNKVKRTSCYLTIKTPTIMAVGSTTYGDYYTSAGVETFKNPDGSTYTKLAVDARRMDIQGTKPGYTKAIPGGTVFKSVNWITEKTATTGEYVDTAYEPSYYVLTGTNGAIYRTYSFTGYNTTFLGKANLSVSSGDVAAFNAKFHPVLSQSGQDVIGIADSIFTLDDAKSTIVYPAVWGGDFSHIYGYSAYHQYMGYKDQDTWYTQSAVNSGVGQPGYYSNRVNFGYFYNGYGFNFDYYTQNSRKISYILTELPYALRVGGFMRNIGDFDKGYNRMWERPANWNADDTFTSQEEDDYNKKSWGSTISKGWYYYDKAMTFPRCVGVQENKSEDYFEDDKLTTLPVYFSNNSGTGSDPGRFGDANWAQLRLKALTTYSTNFLYQEKDNDDDSLSSFKHIYNTTANQSKIAVTDSVYLPATSTTSGGVFYVGTVAAYGVINQVDNGNTDSNYAKSIGDDGSRNDGYQTTYYFMGNDEGTATSAFKYSSSSWHRDDGNQTVYQNKSQISGSGVNSNSDESKEFFVTRNFGGHSQILFNDVYFTMGFTSNREMVYSKIAYGKNASGALVEAFKSYEPLYFLSHYDDVAGTRLPNLYMNNDAATKNQNRDTVNSTNVTTNYLNSPDNDYYNVWFPGEMYNLTKVATKDGITVSVGYAVSGSTYTWVNPSQSTNASTGMGGIYNDGVLAAIVLGKDAAFTNLLYFKDTENFDKTYLTTTRSGSYNQLSGTGNNAGYGTHQRDSVQFTCVDISVESVLSGSDEVSTYYAYYADNKGRLYKSKVATKTTSKSATTSSKPVLVSHISDKSYSTNSAPAYMEEIKVNGQSLGAYFSKITTVSCDGDYIIVGGHSKDSNFKLVIGKITYQQDSAGNPISSSVSWKLVTLSSYGHLQTEDILILDGYAYVAGASKKTAGVTKGFVYAISLDEINANTSLTYNSNLFVGDDKLQDPLYSIAGHK